MSRTSMPYIHRSMDSGRASRIHLVEIGFDEGGLPQADSDCEECRERCMSQAATVDPSTWHQVVWRDAIAGLRDDLEAWEVRFFFRSADPEADFVTMVRLSRQRLAVLAYGGAVMREIAAHDDVPREDHEGRLHDVRAFQRDVGRAYGLLSSVSLSHLTENQIEAADRAARFQNWLAVGATAFLGPSLVVAVAGVDSVRDGQGLASLLILMVASVILTVSVLYLAFMTRGLPRKVAAPVSMVAAGVGVVLLVEAFANGAGRSGWLLAAEIGFGIVLVIAGYAIFRKGPAEQSPTWRDALPWGQDEEFQSMYERVRNDGQARPQ